MVREALGEEELWVNSLKSQPYIVAFVMVLAFSSFPNLWGQLFSFSVLFLFFWIGSSTASSGNLLGRSAK